MNKKPVKNTFVLVACLFSSIAVPMSGHTQPSPARTQFETRCGWLSNPTPANLWLYDADERWTIGVQGSYQVRSAWEFPDFKPQQWVKTNAGSYGYGCACLDVQVNKATRRVLAIRNAEARPLAACRQDRALKKWQFR